MATIPFNLTGHEFRNSWYKYGPGGSKITTDLRTIAYGPIGTVDITTNPNYKVKIAKHQDASTPYTKKGTTMIKMSPATGSFWDPYAGGSSGGATWQDLTWPAGFGVPLTDTALSDQALTRLKRKLASNTSQINLMVPVVELKDLRGLIRSTAASATTLVKTLADIKRTKGASAAKYASDVWLNWSFGISPTIAEANAVAASVVTYLTDSGNRTVVLTGTSRKNWVSSHKDVIAGSLTGLSVQLASTLQIEHTLTYKYTAGFTIPTKSGNNYGLDSHFGLEFGAMIPAIWELTPFSWLVDYFGTMGSFLTDRFVSPSGDTYYVVRSELYTQKLRGDLHYISTGSTILKQTVGSQEMDYLSYVRTPFGQLPHVSLQFKSIDSVGENAVNKLLNLSAILAKSKLK